MFDQLFRFPGIPHGQPIGDLAGAVIAKALRGVDILRAARMSPETLGKRIEEWLSNDERRRIVLLLDEADAFFEADSRDRGSDSSQRRGVCVGS